MAIGSSGHRSRTSNTIGTRCPRLETRPGTAIVSGVLVANTTSARSASATRVDAMANFANAAMRAR